MFSRFLLPGLLTAALAFPPALAQSQAPAAPGPLPVAVGSATAPAAPASSQGMVSALAVEVSGALGGRLVSCPSGLKVSAGAVCLYAKNGLPALRSLLRGRLAARAVGDWKSSPDSRSGSLLVRSGGSSAFLLLAQLSPSETLVVVDSLRAAPSATARPATPAGIVRGQPYVLGSDLSGLVSVTSLGGGRYRMVAAGGGQALSVTVGKKGAQLGSGTVELPLAPASDGRNLLFPLDGLRALACTLTPAKAGVTVACGTASAGLKPIVF